MSSFTSGLSRPLLKQAGINVLLVTASAVLAALLFPPFELWWLAWIALVPLLIALRRTHTLRAAVWLMLLFGLVFVGCALSWLRHIFGFGVFGVAILASLPWLLFPALYRTAAGRSAGFVVLLAPVFWLALEWLRCEGWYFQFSWLQLGFTFASSPNVGGLYPFIGVYGVTALILLVNAGVAEVLLHRRRRVLGLAGYAVPVLALSFYLSISPTPEAPGPDAFHAGVVQYETGNVDDGKRLTKQLGGKQLDLLVWPEISVIDYPLSDPKLLTSLQEIARERKCTFIFGTKAHTPADAKVDWLRRRAMMSMENKLWANIALVIGPDGKVLGTYQKTHPIQFFSDGVPGTSYRTFPTEIGGVGVAICYDMDFAGTFRRLVHNGAEVLVVPTFDAADWSISQHRQHARMAQARAAEAGRWVIRATSSGESQIINPHGVVTAGLTTMDPGAFYGTAERKTGFTLYMRAVYLLPFICVGISLLWAIAIIGLALSRRQKSMTSLDSRAEAEINRALGE